ncbi:hypothetical protein L210DRAFT_3467189 [Boletus edulis BED1]|uniref:Uncharacterized protein n=1 Tax=Boletus edulis BED1 TaxID=1328754 RepID=A0AAD4B9T1_BOLED|nr:hypothetical protein L210DRAFT_3467189 [Boletus edulis BED1]
MIRSIWSILGSCALTLLICVWHAIHFDILRDEEWNMIWLLKGLCVVGSLVAPEAIVAYATTGRGLGYEWSMKHSFFAEMGGFLYRDDKGVSRTIDSREFLRLCKANEIANPVITAKDIKGRSKSDALGKAILAPQLFWFMLQVVVRGSTGLAVTLIELDTVCMAVLSLLVLFLWWDKPLRLDCCHTFYSPREVKPDPPTAIALYVSNAWKSDPSCLSTLMGCFIHTQEAQSTTNDKETTLVVKNDKPSRSKSSRLVDKLDKDLVTAVSCGVTWMILGGLHLIAWNFDFPTEMEKVLWRVASLTLAAGPPATLSLFLIFRIADFLELCSLDDCLDKVEGLTMVSVGILTIVSRLLLVALMLVSLCALPCSAHQTLSWTAYIPHL